MKTEPEDWPERSRELAQLLARTGLGDRQAFAQLYERSSGHLFAVVLRIQRDRALAEDAAAGDLCRGVEGGGRLRRRTQPAADLADGDRAQPRHRQPAPRRMLSRRPQPRTRADDDDAVRRRPAGRPARPARSAAAGQRRARPDALHAGPERAAAAKRGAGLLRRPVACRGGRAAAPAAGHGKELGAARAGGAEELPRTQRAARCRPRREGGPDMDYARPDRADRLAAHYVAGTLRGPRAAASKACCPATRRCARRCSRWQARLMPLTGAIEPVPPPPQVWQRIEARLWPAPPRRGAPPACAQAPVVLARPGRRWPAWPCWRCWCWLANPAPLPAPVVIVLQATPARPRRAATPSSPASAATAVRWWRARCNRCRCRPTGCSSCGRCRRRARRARWA